METNSKLSNAKVLFQDKQYSLECTNNGKKELCIIDSVIGLYYILMVN
jgi:hypothetical protein